MKEQNNLSVLEKIRNEISKKLKPYVVKYEKETDELGKVKLHHKMYEIEAKIFLDNIKKLKKIEYDKLLEEISEAINQKYSNFYEEADTLAFKEAKTSKDYEKYNKRKKLEEKHQMKLLELIENSNLSKTGLERFLVFILLNLGDSEIKSRQELIENLEWFQGAAIVQSRFGFDHNWLVGMSLIQLHENLIKKKITELKYNVQRDDKIPFLIDKLGELIKNNEGRDVILKLEMSHGLKKLRDKLSHAGFKYKISKTDISKIMKDIQELDKILYSNE